MDPGGTDYNGKNLYSISPAGSGFIFPKSAQVFFGNTVTLKFKVIPPAIFHDKIEVLIHLSGFKMYEFGRSDPYGTFPDPQPLKEFFTKKLGTCFQNSVFQLS